MITNALALLALLATQSPDAAPSTPTPSQTAAKLYSDHVAQALRASASARERALSARMYFDDPAAGGRLLRAGAQAAPNDALVQMLWATIGAGEWSGCDAASPCPEQAMAWAKVEPDNALAWLPSFETVYKSGDEKQIDAAIARMAQASRIDDHFVDAWLAYRQALAARPMPASVAADLSASLGVQRGDAREEANSVMAMSYATALPVPMAAITRACKRESHPQSAPARFEDCARLGRAMLRSDASVFTQMIGSALVRISGLQDDTDRETRRVLEWRQRSAAEAMAAPGGADGYFSDLASTRSERRAQELVMARHGIALAPPAGWKASSP